MGKAEHAIVVPRLSALSIILQGGVFVLFHDLLIVSQDQQGAKVACGECFGSPIPTLLLVTQRLLAVKEECGERGKGLALAEFGRLGWTNCRLENSVTNGDEPDRRFGGR